MEKTKYYAIRIEFQEKGSTHIHSFILIYDSPNFENEAPFIEFVAKTINAELPGHLIDPELFERVNTYQVHTHSTTYSKRLSYVRYFTKKIIITKPLDSNIQKYSTKVSQKLY